MAQAATRQRLPAGYPVARWTGVRELAASPDLWRDLMARAIEPNPFYSLEYLAASADLAGRDFRCITIRESDAPDAALLGLFPLQQVGLNEGVFVPALEFVHNDYIRLTTPLIDPNHAETVWEAFLHALAENEKGSRVLLSRYQPAMGATRAALASVVAADGLHLRTISTHSRPAVASGSTWHDYARRMDRHRRNELKRQDRRLKALGEVSLHTVVDSGEKRAALDDFLRIETQGWKGSAGTAMAAKAAPERFVQQAFAGPEGEIDVVALNGRAIAVGLNLRTAGHLYTVKTAYDEAYRTVAPGMALASFQARATLDRGPAARLDSCATPDHPMGGLWLEREDIEWFALAPSPAVGRHRVDALATTLDALARLRNWARFMLKGD